MYPLIYGGDDESFQLVEIGGVTQFVEVFTKGTVRGVLSNTIKDSTKIKKKVNDMYTFGFSCYEEELKSAYVSVGNKVYIENQFFDIVYLEKTHNTDLTYRAQCEHISYRLEEIELDSYAFTGTPSEILADVIEDENFVVGQVDYTDPITVSFNSKITKRKIVKELANLLGAKLTYTDDGYTFNLLNKLGENKGYSVRLGKNLIGVRKTIDSRGGLKTYYEVDLVTLKNSTDYIEQDLQDFDVVEEGDSIQIVDEVANINVTQQVVTLEYDPVFEVNLRLEITNELELITDTINEIATTAVVQDTLYNNAAISSDFGFRATRSDKLARSTMGGGDISLDVGDGLGGYTQAMYFDVLTGKYKFVGDIEASGTITGADFIGGTIDIGSGTFQVDSLGNVIANSITIGGGSGISNLTDAGDLATLDSINGTYIDNNSITTPKIATGAVDATKINVGSLSAISANIGTVTAGLIKGVTYSNVSETGSLSIEQFGTSNFADFKFRSTSQTEPIFEIRDNISSAGIYNSGVQKMFLGGGFSGLNGLWNYNGYEVADKNWVNSQGFLTSGALSGYATQSYVNSYAVQDLSSQGISLQYISANNTVEVRTNGTYRGAFTLA